MEPVTKQDIKDLKENIGQMFVEQTRHFQEEFDGQGKKLEVIKSRLDEVAEFVEDHEKRIITLEKTVSAR